MLTDVLLICFIAGILSIDVRTVGGTMLSRPLIVAPLTGLLLGNVQAGLIVAVLLELLWIGLLPVGAYLPVESLPVAVIATTLSAVLLKNVPASIESIIIFCVLVAIPFGFISRWGENHIRGFNIYLSNKLNTWVDNEEVTAISQVQYANIAISFLKGFLVCFLPLLFLMGEHLISKIFISLPYQMKRGMEISYSIVPAVGFAVALEIFLTKGFSTHLFVVFAAASLLIYFLHVNPFLVLGFSALAGAIVVFINMRKEGGKNV